MKLNFKLPDREKALILNRLDGEEILCCTPVDLNPAGEMAGGWIVVTRLRLFVMGEGNHLEELEIARGTEYKSVTLVGNGVLEALFDGEPRILARYTMRHVPRYACIASILNVLARGENPVITNDDDEDICPKCGRSFPEGSKICPKCVNKVAILRKLWMVIKPHWPLMVLAMILFWLVTGITLAIPYMHRLFIDNCLKPGKVATPDLSLIIYYIGIIALLHAANTIVTAIRGRVMVVAGGKIAADLRNLVYGKIQALSLNYLDRRKTGDLMNRINGDTVRISNFIQHQAVFGLNQLLIMIGIWVILFSASWKLALLVFIPIPLVMVFIRLTWDRMHLMYHQQWKVMVKANSLLQDILSGIRVVKAFGQEKKESDRFRAASRVVADMTCRNEKHFNTLFPAMNFIAGMGVFFVLYYGGKLVLQQNMDLGELVQFAQYSGLLYGPLGFMSFFPRMFADALQAVEKVFEVIDAEPEIKDGENARRHKVKGAVTFQNVSFGYLSHEPVLDNINLEVAPGEMIGLVGHSGAGKSTLINLVMRFYDVDSGQIFIDGVDIREIRQQDLRAQMGAVLQETFLFAGTILDNIRYAKADATLEEVITAAKIANAHDFIVRFPDGYDSMVGENGCNLSGGERQRIAIARAILHNPKILILDEATASLDIESEQQIQEALGRLMKNRTTFAIAHRLSTLRNADRLLVIEKGKLAEIGTHEELIKKKGIYYRLVMAQRRMAKGKGEEENGGFSRTAVD